MGKWGVCEEGWRKGPWTPEEDNLLINYVSQYGEGRWSSVSKCTGLQRSGKSSRLRWVNYLRPGLKKGQLSPQEQGIIVELHALWGNKWSTIARYLPGRTDNEIKNYWRTHFKKQRATTTKQEKRNRAGRLKGSAQLFPHQTMFPAAEAATTSIIDDDDPRNNIDDCRQETSTPMYPDVVHVGNLHHQVLPVVCDDEDNNYCSIMGMWSDFTPQDCYIWGGLWD